MKFLHSGIGSIGIILGMGPAKGGDVMASPFGQAHTQDDP